MAVKKYRIAIIGCGMICNAAHIPSILELKKQGMAEIVAVADIRECAARETAQRWEIPAWYTDPQRMLDEVPSDHLQIILDAVNLIGPDTADRAEEIVEDGIRRLGDRAMVLHMKDYVLRPNEVHSQHVPQKMVHRRPPGRGPRDVRKAHRPDLP